MAFNDLDDEVDWTLAIVFPYLIVLIKRHKESIRQNRILQWKWPHPRRERKRLHPNVLLTAETTDTERPKTSFKFEPIMLWSRTARSRSPKTTAIRIRLHQLIQTTDQGSKLNIIDSSVVKTAHREEESVCYECLARFQVLIRDQLDILTLL